MTSIDQTNNPARYYHNNPSEVLNDSSLSCKEKIEVLRRWAYDEREIAVAEEENMQSEDNHHAIILDEILRVLIKLGVKSDENGHPPTKQG